MDRQAELFAPESDLWDTERLSHSADLQLRRLEHFLEHPTQIDAAALADVVTEGFSCTTIRPETPEPIDDTNLFHVHRWQPDGADPLISTYRGAAGFAEALHQLANGRDTLRAHFKVIHVDAAPEFFRTRVLFECVQHDSTKGVQQTATWWCRWKNPDEGDVAAKLESIRLESHEQVTIIAPGGRLFVDCTASAMQDNPCYEQQVLTGINHWVPRVVDSGMSLFGYHGLAVGDANGDGLDDIYACDAGGLPNRLYRQNPDGTVTDVSATVGTDFLDSSRSALFLDLDNDGDQDLVVAMLTLVLFLENVQNEHFRPRYQHAIQNARSLSAADFDRDGALDVYVCAYEPADDVALLPTPIPYHDANNGGANALLRNRGRFMFEDVTTQVGLEAGNQRFSFAAAWGDFDNDNDMDLYVANDFGRNCLYRNDAGHFHNVAAAAGVEDMASGMSVAWGDVDRNGYMDLYVGNMFSAAGNRIAYQRRFTTGRETTVSNLQRMARGNTLFLNTGGSIFRDVSDDAGIAMGRWAWASQLADWNNDGWLDAVVANGFITNEDTGDL